MPWHEVQYLKITCRAGPFGGITCGRVGRGANWPADVAADAHSTSAAIAHAPALEPFRDAMPQPLRTALLELNAAIDRIYQEAALAA